MEEKKPKKLIEKLPPQSIESEQAVLGGLMIDPDAIIRIADTLKPQDFYKKSHRLIYEAILDLYERKEPIDILNIQTRLKDKDELKTIGGTSYLAELVNCIATSAHIVSYAKIIGKKKILRDLINASHYISELSFKEEMETEEILDEAEKNIFAIAQRTLRQDFVSVKSALEDAFERIDALHRGDGTIKGIPTGFPRLDHILAGMQKSDLIILAARPSLGKTTLAMDVARYAAHKEKVPVGIFSLEMSKEQIIDRIIAAQANIDLWKLRTGRLQENDFMNIQEAMGQLSESPIFIDDSGSSTVMQMRTLARRLQAEHGLGLLVIDYLQLMDSGLRYDNRVEAMSQVSRSLKNLARELNIPILALSQLSRAVESRSPQIPKLSDLRESGCLSGDTLITRADTGERIPIKNLVGKTNIPIFSINKNQKLEIRKISKVFSSGIKQIFKLKTKSGRIIKASANHPFLTIEGWRQLDELTVKTHIAIPRSFPKIKCEQKLTKDELILLAHLLGDGCILPKQPFHYTSADKKNILIVARKAKKLFSIPYRIIKQKNWYHVYLPSPYHLSRNKHHPITNWFNKLNISRVRSYEKRIPEAVFESATPQIKLFLRHLWATDGNISLKKIKKRKVAGSIYFASTSKMLAQQVHHLLLRLGIFSSLRQNKKQNYRICYQVHIQNSEMQKLFCQNIGSYGSRGKIIPFLLKKLEKIKSNPNLDIIPKTVWQSLIYPIKNTTNITWRAFSNKINTAYCGNTLFNSGLSRQRMSKVATALKSKTLQKLAHSDIYWDQITSITPAGKKEVFDATVPVTHNLVANDFIVHNSIEQDADVVLFIYREDKDKQNTERKNIADILVAKHRNGPVGRIELFFDADKVSFKTIDREHQTEEFL